MEAIQVRQLTKTFRVKRKASGLLGSVKSLWKPDYVVKQAVLPIDLTVGQGETVAFLGPNGAGKSTTIKMLTGILHPTSGSAEVLGLCPWKDRQKLAFRIGSVFGQKSQLWYHLPPVDTFELMSRIYELKRGDYLARRQDMIERFELGPYLQTPVRKLSLGERMRCELACALLHRPSVVFLDEPTIGLDVIAKRTIRELILHLNREEGTTIFLTSHDAGDIEHLCERAIVINHGQVILDESVSRMRTEFLTAKTIRLQLADETAAYAHPGATILDRKGYRLTLSVDTSKVSIDEVLADIVRSVRILDVTIEDAPMEDIISHIYSRTAEETG